MMHSEFTCPSSMAAAASICFWILLISSLHLSVAQIGVNYGRVGNNLPPPWRVVQLFQQYNISRMRIYDTDPATLSALRRSGIQLTFGVLHDDLDCLASSQSCADNWVNTNICPYFPDVTFRTIIVGNEISPIDPNTARFSQYVLPAMQNIYNAVSRAPALGPGVINISTAINTNILGMSFPPASGMFRPDVGPYIDPIVRFLSDTGAPLFAGVYPYFAYANDRKNIDIRYALLDPGYPGVVAGGILYQNLFYAIVDAVNAAVEKSLGAGPLAGKKSPPDVNADESGWATRRKPPPPAGCIRQEDDVANTRNARAYVNNLIRVVKTGSPMRPDHLIETYIFAMFDENKKPGNVEERNFGMFSPLGRPKYRVNFS